MQGSCRLTSTAPFPRSHTPDMSNGPARAARHGNLCKSSHVRMPPWLAHFFGNTPRQVSCIEEVSTILRNGFQRFRVVVSD